MTQKLRVLLVRHGQSEANANQEIGKRKADHAIELTEKGHEQAKAVGRFLAKYLIPEDSPRRVVRAQEHIALSKIRMWNSPYLRTRQTSKNILATALVSDEPVHFGEVNYGARIRQPGQSIFYDAKALEHLGLHEQLFGIFDSLSDEERANRFPTEWAHYSKCKAFEGKVWARHPGGESRVDVALRLHNSFFGTIQRDFERHYIKTIVVVAHGTVNRAFTTMWCHHTWEFLEKEPNPRNCSVRLLENGEDKGYIFDGFEP